MTTRVMPFDFLAQDYDAGFTHSAIGQLQRRRVWHYLNHLLVQYQRPLQILEINCGTGEDAWQLAALGHTVLATDASAAMINVAQTKPATSPAAVSPEFRVSAFDELGKLLQDKKFDLVFSDFGGLNCIDKKAVRVLAQTLSDHLKPEGKLFWVLMGDRCWNEVTYYLRKGKPGKAFRRWGRSAQFSAGESSMPVYYYYPAALAALLQPLFKQISHHPIGLFVPPSYREADYQNQPQRLERLYRKEERFAPSWLSRFADHFCIIFEKEAAVL